MFPLGGETTKTRNQVMQPVFPAEMTGGLVQLVVYFITGVSILLSFLLTARA